MAKPNSKIEMDPSQEVSRQYGNGVKIGFQPEGNAWRERRYKNGRLQQDMGLVDLKRVLAIVGNDSFEAERARKLDPMAARRP